MTAPLNGVRVLDLSRVLAGPFASQTLADLGAEVIKIERPGTGDDTRQWGPPYARDATGQETQESAYFLAANRGKQSVCIDMATSDGQRFISELADQSDVVIENFKVGQLARYHLDAATLCARSPRLIYCSITGFGQTGPYCELPGYDFLIQGLGGLMSITGHTDDAPGNGPVKTGVAIADLFSGQYATIAILAALNKRAATGRGDIIDISLLDCQVAMLANQAMNYLTTGLPPQRLGNAHPNIVPYQAFATMDGHIILAIGNDTQFSALCDVIQRADLARDPRYATNPQRVENRAALISEIEKILLSRTASDWLASFTKANVPAGSINTLDAVFADPQVKFRGLELSLPHATAGHVPSVANPIRFADQSSVSPPAPPTLGQHTDAVLSERLGLSPERLKNLRTNGVIA
ncbi:MAG: CoA transferase [Hyphomicrobium sp.]|nr:MAG: CoA transferase [Hyphomicrobium sp.]PPC99065.1 MAG: CoA transferase [Hyphomicrobium sp.]